MRWLGGWIVERGSGEFVFNIYHNARYFDGKTFSEYLVRMFTILSRW